MSGRRSSTEQAGTSSSCNVRKRISTDPPSTPNKKSPKKNRKVDEKENNSKAPTPSSSSPIHSMSRNPTEPLIYDTSLRKNRPRHIEKLEKVLKTCEDGKEIYDFYSRADERMARRFLVRNVAKMKRIEVEEATCRIRRMPKLKDVLHRFQEKALERSGLDSLCELKYKKISSWDDGMDSNNPSTTTARVESFTVIVDTNGRVKIFSHGFVIIDLLLKSLSEAPNLEVYAKRIRLTQSEFDNADKIYFFAIVKRNAVVTEGIRIRCRRSTNPTDVPPSPEDQILEELTRVGCYCIYEKDGYDKTLIGVQRMILVEQDRYNNFVELLTRDPMEQLKNVDLLELVDKRNSEKLDQHISRLYFYSQEEGADDENLEEGTIVEPDDVEPPTAAVATSPRVMTLRMGKTYRPNDRRSNPSTSTAASQFEQFDAERYRSLDSNSKWLDNRFPCFQKLNSNTVGPVTEYFSDSHVKKNTTYIRKAGRPKGRRSAPKKKIPLPVEVEDLSALALSPPMNTAPGGEIKYGLDFIPAPGHIPYVLTQHKMRDGSVVPPFDDQHPVNPTESYVLNNPKLFTDFDLSEKLQQEIPEEDWSSDSEIAVVKDEITPEDVAIFNYKLERAKGKVKVKPILRGPIRQEDDDEPREDTDLDGRVVPTFTEIFFPYGKTEIYNILCRYFYSEAGHRPGSFTARYKSRLLTGFINKYHNHIFTHNLERIFEKQLQMIALRSPDFKSEHLMVPLNRFRQLKKEWKAANQVAGPSSSSSSSSS